MSVRNGTRQQRRRTATRAKLMDAAREVFAQKGLDLARIDEITERADVGKGTFYYHFRTKERLIALLIENLLGELTQTLEEECSPLEDLGEMLDRIITVHIRFFSNRWEDFVLYYQGRADLTLQEGYKGIESPFLRYLETIERLVDSRIDQQVPPAALRRIACAVAGFVSGYYSFAVIGAEEQSIAEAVAPLKRAMVASLSRFIVSASQPAGSREAAR
jgi:AcrR family transcriptional regulator